MQLAMDRTTGQQVAIKYISRHTMDAKTVLREVRSPRAAKPAAGGGSMSHQPRQLYNIRDAGAAISHRAPPARLCPSIAPYDDMTRLVPTPAGTHTAVLPQ